MNFTQKLGPLPVWAWAALAVGGYVVLRLRGKSTAAAQPNQIYGGQLNPENAPGYPGNFALNPGSLAPSSAMPTTNTTNLPDQPISAPPDTGNNSGTQTGSTVANAPQGAPPNIFSPYGIYTGQPGFTPGVPVHFPK